VHGDYPGTFIYIEALDSAIPNGQRFWYRVYVTANIVVQSIYTGINEGDMFGYSTYTVPVFCRLE
jgi:hypothetical protein